MEVGNILPIRAPDWAVINLHKAWFAIIGQRRFGTIAASAEK
jgi:hypothetical protein